MSQLHCDCEWSIVGNRKDIGCAIRIGSQCQQPHDHFEPIKLRGEMQSSKADLVFRIDIGPFVYKQHHDISIVMPHCIVQRSISFVEGGPALTARTVDIGSTVDEEGNIHLSIDTGL